MEEGDEILSLDDPLALRAAVGDDEGPADNRAVRDRLVDLAPVLLVAATQSPQVLSRDAG